MSIDEAIKHCEEVMMENLEKTKDRNASDPIAINCFECADEHRQLAEWLKELKAHREAWEKLRTEIREEAEFAYADFDEYKYEVLGINNVDDLPHDDYRYGMERILELISKYRPKEGDAE